MVVTQGACLFCNLPQDRILIEFDEIVVLTDVFPVSRGHTLVIPKRHVVSFFETTEKEKAEPRK